jgi:hypothetical protein
VAGTAELCFEVGMDAYLTKPFTANDLDSTLRRWTAIADKAAAAAAAVASMQISAPPPPPPGSTSPVQVRPRSATLPNSVPPVQLGGVVGSPTRPLAHRATPLSGSMPPDSPAAPGMSRAPAAPPAVKADAQPRLGESAVDMGATPAAAHSERRQSDEASGEHSMQG